MPSRWPRRRLGVRSVPPRGDAGRGVLALAGTSAQALPRPGGRPSGRGGFPGRGWPPRQGWASRRPLGSPLERPPPGPERPTELPTRVSARVALATFPLLRLRERKPFAAGCVGAVGPSPEGGVLKISTGQSQVPVPARKPAGGWRCPRCAACHPFHGGCGRYPSVPPA